MRSMTGFGRGVAPFGKGHVVIEIRSVNHRFLEIRSRAPRELMAAEALLDRLVHDRLRRGYCTVNILYEGPQGGTSVVDKGALSSHLEDLIDVGRQVDLCLADLVPLLSAAPDLFTAPKIDDTKKFESAITDAFDKAIVKLIEMREHEGVNMEKDIVLHLDQVRHRADQLKVLAKAHSENTFPKLKERINTLLEGTDANIDPRRIETEAAFLVERADINEEITRLLSHCEQLDKLREVDEAIGRRLEFLLQEMNRESNTIGSKSSLPEISHVVVDLKGELEKMRELVQNVE